MALTSILKRFGLGGPMQGDTDRQLAEARARIRKLQAKMKTRNRSSYSMGMLAGVVSGLRPGDVVCDAGANVGDVTAELAATGATVHAFEPDPFCIDLLRKRFADVPNVVIHAVAVGVAPGRIMLRRREGFTEDPRKASIASTTIAGGRYTDDDPATRVEVEVIDFPAFLTGLLADRDELAFVKLDIEGSELEVLRAMDAQGLFDRIRLTVAETHEGKFADLRHEFLALRDAFAPRFPTSRVNLDWR